MIEQRDHWNGEVRMSNGFYREMLNEHGKALYDAMYVWFRDELTAESDSRAFDISGVGPDDVPEVLFSILNDHPELICLGHSKPTYAIIPGSEIDGEGHLTVTLHDPYRDFSFAYSREEREDLSERIGKWADSVVKRIKGNGDRERVISLTAIFAQDFSFLDSAPSHDVTGVLSGVLVCEGFARAFKLICDRLGIWCIMVWGQGISAGGEYVNHCWNIVRVDGRYYHVDPTWANSGSMPDPGGVLGNGRKVFSYEYMFMSDSDLEGSHTMMLEYPKCDDPDAEYYRKNGWILRFNRDFTNCLTDPSDIKRMIRKTRGLYTDVYILRCRLVDENGKNPCHSTATDMMDYIADYIIPEKLGISGRSIRYYTYNEVSGDLRLVFTLYKTKEATDDE